ncbi:GyrI-like domain-containing protein [Paenibacillus septentrionalis]|uniref:GyrI-like domain-containing protein n=1 Tax=Paenibacillus septentrionalis TaxID=429342 RepID=A0ABW1V9Q1_9BACL
MNMLSQFNEAMDFIEQHLMDELDMNQLSRIAGCSDYHFRRMFSTLSGMPLSEYIRRRKLSAAAELLQAGGKVIDVAMQLGYDSPEAFSKAFLLLHGILPSQAKKSNTMLKAIPPMFFQLTIQGGVAMNYRIVEKEAFRIIGFKKRITLQFEGVNHQLDDLVQKLTPEVIAELKSLSNMEPAGILNVSANFTDRTNEGTELDQYIGIATNAANLSYDALQVPASSWAVFEVVGEFPKAVQDTWASIYAQWFPSSGYELTGGPEMLWNEGPDTSKPDFRSEIWIPVRRL